MNTPGVAVLLSALFFCVPCHGMDCLPSSSFQSGLSVAAPEMLRPLATDPHCVSAQQLVSRIRSQPATVATPGAYVPLTKDDNTPWRFDMSQNGKRMTSAEFDAWMKAKGIRVATGKPGTSTGSDTPPPVRPAVETGK